MTPLRRLATASVAVLPLLLAGCGGDEAPPAPTSFAPFHYDYLTKIRLNVASIEIEQRAAPIGPNDVAAESPDPPAQALEQMARDRLVAAGVAGRAVFTIDQASILAGPGGALDGQLAVHLTLDSAGGAPGAFAEARVARSRTPGPDDENRRAELYAFTRQMMDDMNVELEYQVKRSLKAFLVPSAVTDAPVEAQPLPGAPTPPSAPPASAPSPTPLAPPAPPDASAPMIVPPGTPEPTPPALPPEPYAVPAPQPMSPPPGYLQLPPGYSGGR